ncbi:MAG TPA: GGDEF domain-containing protein [Ideonella sp.]|nr:GGDEF domain-containing protein [Ideonella sp.]
MTLDIQTLLVLMLATSFALALALPVIMVGRVGVGARRVQAAMAAQALGWAALLAARPFGDRAFSTLWIALLGGSFALLWRAMAHWLGTQRGRRAVDAVALATPLGYGLGFSHYAFRVGWANFGLAALMLSVCALLARRARGVSPRWRGVAIACLGALALVTLWRGVLGAFFTARYPELRSPHPANVLATTLYPLALVLVTLAALVAWREEAERELKRLATTDGLTGLLNRQAFVQRAEGSLAWARRYGHRLALLLVDLDHFKRINDAGGHAAGDAALRRFADALRSCLRRGDLACRWGGEEFAVLLWQADASAALSFDARLRAALAAHDGDGAPLGYSAGLVPIVAPAESLDPQVRRADDALYRAKEAGRGRTVAAQ